MPRKSDGVDYIVVMSDMHFGSSVGLLPPNIHTPEGGTYTQNPVQKWLWERWIHATQHVLPSALGKSKWALVLNGDLTEGTHHGTTQIVSNDPLAHVDVAIPALQPLAESADEVFVVEGTECHTQGFERTIAVALGAKTCPQTKGPVWPQLLIENRGILCSFKHHIATSLRPWAESSAYAAALTKEQSDAAKYGHPVPKVVVRSHRHIFGHWKTTGGLLVCTPPWQLATRYARKVTQSSITPIGLVVLDFKNPSFDGLPTVKELYYVPECDPIVNL